MVARTPPCKGRDELCVDFVTIPVGGGGDTLKQDGRYVIGLMYQEKYAKSMQHLPTNFVLFVFYEMLRLVRSGENVWQIKEQARTPRQVF